MSLSQLVSSHLVHLYTLALPDYLTNGHRLGSIAEMLPGYKKEIERFLRMKEVINGITSAFGGRALHPVSMVMSGFTSTPERGALGVLIKQLEGIKEDAVETLRMFEGLQLPELTNKSEYVCIKSTGDYAVNMGRIVSSGGIDAPEEDYPELFQEEEVPYSNAKRTVVKGRSALMVGALSRVNINHGTLHEDARKVMGLRPPSDNPFHNNLAQAVEIVHGVSELTELLDGLTGEKPWVDIKVREGQGSAVTEAPRGLLFHSYTLNRRGFLSLEENLKRLVKEHIEEPEEELTLKCEMLVRAYDPCFSCSVH
jgi:coenzyme F420-reducing hydrogenase alpha subunit